MRARDERVQASIEEQGLEYLDPELQAYLDSVSAPLAAHAPGQDPRHFRIAALRSPGVYAFSLQSGAIYLSAGELARVDDEAQLAFLIAREMSHLTFGHARERLIDQRNKVIAAKIAGAPLGPLSALTDLGFAAAMAANTLEQEREADRAGLEWIGRAGFTTTSAPHVFAAAIDSTDRSGGGVLSADPASDARGRACVELVTTGAVAANSGGRNDAELMRRRFEKPSFDSVRLALQTEMYELASSNAAHVRSHYGASALLLYYEGESLLRIAAAPKQVPLAFQARSMNRRDREAADARALKRLRAGEPAQLAEAEGDFRRALELDPTHGPSRRGLGEALLLEGKLAAAEAALTQYLTANPEAPDARLVEGFLKRIRASAASAQETSP